MPPTGLPDGSATPAPTAGATFGSRPIGSLISALETITSELEKHTADMNYPGTDEFNVHTFHRHPFDDRPLPRVRQEV